MGRTSFSRTFTAASLVATSMPSALVLYVDSLQQCGNKACGGLAAQHNAAAAWGTGAPTPAAAHLMKFLATRCWRSST